MKISKKQQAVLALGAAAVVTVGGTFAWFSTSDKVENVFDMEDFDVSISEAFDPTEPVTPGTNITKQVGVTNYGDVPVYVRMRFEETLVLQHFVPEGENVKNRLLVYSDNKEEKNKFQYEDGTSYTVPSGGSVVKAVYDQKVIDNLTNSGWSIVELPSITGPSDTGNIKIYSKTSTATAESANTVTQYFAYDESDNQIVYVTKTDENKFTARYAFHVKSQANTTESGIHEKKDDDITHTFISLKLDTTEENNWTLDNAATNNEGYYYYKKILVPGESTGNLLDSVSFAENMPNDYLGAVYTITPYMEAIQATPEAVEAEWYKEGTYPVQVSDSGSESLVWSFSN